MGSLARLRWSPDSPRREGVRPRPDRVEARLRGLLHPVVRRIGCWLLPRLDAILVRYSLVGDPPIFDSALFRWAAELERCWTVVRDEAESVLRHQAIPPLRAVSGDHDYVASDDKWRVFLMQGYGVRYEANRALCPQTTRLLECIPGLQTALFSVACPGTHIARHVGVTKAILTCHLGLHVPPGRCRMRIGDHDYAWQEGRILIFDDMYPHEVWNETDQLRVNLMLHVKRPMRFPGSLLRDAVLALVRRSHFVQDIRRNLDEWAPRADGPGPGGLPRHLL